MKVLHALLRAARPRHVRELGAVCGLSPGGVWDIVRRLEAAGVLERTTSGNRRCYTLALTEEEREILARVFLVREQNALQQRAERFSVRAQEKLSWMDATYSFYRRLKGKRQ